MLRTTSRRPQRVGIIVARYHEAVTTRLLAGAQAALAEAGVDAGLVDVHWVAGAWELPVVARALVMGGRHHVLCALGVVVRGETPHFDYVAGEATRGLMALQMDHGVPVGFGVLTCDTLAQAQARAGGAAGNKGAEAMAAALDAAREIARADDRPQA